MTPETMKTSPAKIDWAALLRLAVAMGVMPDAFWQLSWREWQMLNSPPQHEAMSPAVLAALMVKFPDKTT